MNAPEEWYYVDGSGSAVGPMDAASLLRLKEEGVITGRTMVAPAGDDGWVELKDAAPGGSAPRNQAVKFSCGSCGQRVSIREEHAGMSFRCPSCGNSLTAPASGAVSRSESDDRVAASGEDAPDGGGGKVVLASVELNRRLLIKILAAALIIILLVFVFRRPAVERKYIAQLSQARETACLAQQHWKGVEILAEFPYGPHYSNMSVDQALSEVRHYQGSLDQFQETMRTLTRQVNAISASCGEVSRLHPDQKDKIEGVGFSGDLSMTPGDPAVDFSLEELKRSIDRSLDSLHASHPK